jgi:hypothetical protein
LLILYIKLFARLDSNLVVKAELPLHSPVAESSAAHEPLVKSSGDEEKMKDAAGTLLVPKR